MLRTSDILDEKDKHLRAQNVDVTFPLKEETKKLINDMLEQKKLDNKLIDTLFPNLSLTTGINCNKNVTMKYFEF